MAIEMPEPPEPKKTGHRWIDLAVALAALSVSVMSIFVAQHTSETMEKLVHASSWPFLELGSGNTNGQGRREIAFGVENVGTGPARIHWFEVAVDGEPLPRDGHLLSALLNACCREAFEAALARNNGNLPATFDYEVSSPVRSRFLGPNGEISAIRWAQTEQNAELWAALDTARQTRITMATCYCSVFDECWIARSDAFPPEPINSCTPNEPALSTH